MFSVSLFSLPSQMNLSRRPILTILGFIFLSIIIEWVQRDKQHALQIESFKLPEVVKWGLYYALIIIIFIFGGIQQEFIYFQF